ncbi:cell wall hydrolase [Zavarzinia compransoris]|uniref:Cell wall hydrolase n=1 Tax=Zavarzinia compransoris TaxID=1264899 RepID=A0A317DZ39_9PROT|nr:cell wall hydrolase [Zavarzinia compransoris]PWR19160.1 cell wall hydrolase [Zavarzinia compransoris]TDP49174.1 cell wall hydrolase [Zavarzinia compransoris]
MSPPRAPFAARVAPLPAPGEADRDTLARTLWGEARGEGVPGMAAVAGVVVNRMLASARLVAAGREAAWWCGPDAVSVCRAPWQFSCWNLGDPNRGRIEALAADGAVLLPARTIADAALDGRLGDSTFGADHYHARGVLPAWARGRRPVVAIGRHLFYKLGN